MLYVFLKCRRLLRSPPLHPLSHVPCRELLILQLTPWALPLTPIRITLVVIHIISALVLTVPPGAVLLHVRPWTTGFQLR